MSNNTIPPAKPKTLVVGEQSTLKGELKKIGGSRSDDWNQTLANQAVDALWVKNSDQMTLDAQFKGTVDAMLGIGPKDELEGMMATQLLAAHNAAMECFRRAMISEQTFEGRKENLNQANKLSRTYATLLEALNRHRGKGQQKMTVEHVHVHAGGQAVVGTVELPGGGGKHRNEDQAHGKAIDAPFSSMWGQDTIGEAMPVAGDEERSL